MTIWRNGVAVWVDPADWRRSRELLPFHLRTYGIPDPDKPLPAPPPPTKPPESSKPKSVIPTSVEPPPPPAKVQPHTKRQPYYEHWGASADPWKHSPNVYERRGYHAAAICDPHDLIDEFEEWLYGPELTGPCLVSTSILLEPKRLNSSR